MNSTLMNCDDPQLKLLLFPVFTCILEQAQDTLMIVEGVGSLATYNRPTSSIKLRGTRLIWKRVTFCWLLYLIVRY